MMIILSVFFWESILCLKKSSICWLPVFIKTMSLFSQMNYLTLTLRSISWEIFFSFYYLICIYYLNLKKMNLPSQKNYKMKDLTLDLEVTIEKPKFIPHFWSPSMSPNLNKLVQTSPRNHQIKYLTFEFFHDSDYHEKKFFLFF